MISPVSFSTILPGSARRVASRARRADRVPALFGLACDANQSLDELVAMIVGVGAVGATTALSLAHLQIGELRLVDRGCFKPASLPTQPITPALIDQPKATSVARLCKQVSPRTRVHAFDGPLQDLALADMVGVNVLIVAGDNLTVLRDTGQRCLNLGIKMIHAAVHGETLTAQCRTFSHATADSPCPVCLFGADEFQMMNDERVFSCEGFRTWAGSNGRSRQPTMSLRPLSALCGEAAALQATRLALGLRPAVEDTMLEICAYTWRSLVTPIRRNPKCPCAHARYSLQTAPRTLCDCTLAELKRAARPVVPLSSARSRGEEATLLLVEGFRWAERGLCGCAEPRPLDRFVRPGQPAGRCARCRQPLYPQPFYSHDAIPPAFIERFHHRTLRSLGAKDCRGVLACRGEQTTLLINPARKARS